MDKYQFGSSDSAVILAELVEGNRYVRRKVSSNLTEFNKVQQEIMDSNLSDRLKKNFLIVTLHRFQHKFYRFDGKIKTYSLNVLSQKHRNRINSLK